MKLHITILKYHSWLMPNITTNLVITYTKLLFINIFALICLSQLKIIFVEHFSVDQHTILRSYTSISKLQVLPKLCIV